MTSPRPTTLSQRRIDLFVWSKYTPFRPTFLFITLVISLYVANFQHRSHWMLSIICIVLLYFRSEKTREFGYNAWWRSHDRRIGTMYECDRQTDRRTHRGNSARAIAYSLDPLYNATFSPCHSSDRQLAGLTVRTDFIELSITRRHCSDHPRCHINLFSWSTSCLRKNSY